jgi:hypothetical protein
MKYLMMLLGAFSFLFTSCGEKNENVFFILENSIDVARTEVIIFTKEEVMLQFPELKRYDVPALMDSLGNIFPYQLDNLDSSEGWDEMAVAIDFEALEKKKVRFTAFAKALQPLFPKTTDVHLGVGNVKPYANEVQKYSRTTDPRDNDTLFVQMEGPAWENNKVGFRMYFDPRNGIDIFGKTTKEPTLAKQGLKTNYHDQADWGMDILKVGNSLGAGSVAIKYQDSLYRLQGVYGARFEALAEGPARAIFTMTYLDEPIGDQLIKVVHTISIEKGDWFYKSKVELHGKTDGMELVTGIVDLKPNEVEQENLSQDGFALYSYGKQSENDDHLGMAIISTTTDVSVSEAPEEGNGITKTHLIKFNKQPSHTYYFMSGWEASNEVFSTKKGFSNAVITAARSIANPVMVK